MRVWAPWSEGRAAGRGRRRHRRASIPISTHTRAASPARGRPNQRGGDRDHDVVEGSPRRARRGRRGRSETVRPSAAILTVKLAPGDHGQLTELAQVEVADLAR